MKHRVAIFRFYSDQTSNGERYQRQDIQTITQTHVEGVYINHIGLHGLLDIGRFVLDWLWIRILSIG